MKIAVELSGILTSDFGSCPECGDAHSSVVWGWGDLYTDLICPKGHSWTSSKAATMEETYRNAVKVAAEKTAPVSEVGKVTDPVDPEPGYETGGFDIMKMLVKKQHRHMDVRKTSE